MFSQIKRTFTKKFSSNKNWRFEISFSTNYAQIFQKGAWNSGGTPVFARWLPGWGAKHRRCPGFSPDEPGLIIRPWYKITFLSKFLTDLSNLDCVTVWKNCFVGMLFCIFLTNQSQSIVISSQMDFRIMISIKNQCRIIIYSLINVQKGAKQFFFKCSSKNFNLNVLKISFSTLKRQNSITHHRTELLGL